MGKKVQLKLTQEGWETLSGAIDKTRRKKNVEVPKALLDDLMQDHSAVLGELGPESYTEPG